MRTTTCLVLLACLVGCADAPEPEPEFDFDAYFKTPTYYTVVSGDTLNKIAARNGVTADDLMLWNGIDTHVIEVDQVLLIWEGGKPPPMPGRARTAGKGGGSGDRGAPGVTHASVAQSLLPEDWEAPTMARTSGVLGVLGYGDDLGGTDLDATLASTTTVRADKVTPSTSLAGRGKIGGGEAEMMTASIETRFNPALSGGGLNFASGAVTPPRLSYPGRKRCLAGPTGSGLSDYGSVSADGLSANQIKRSLGSFVGYTAKCIPRGSTGAFSVRAEITVGCDGRVTQADLTSRGGAPSHVAACIEKTLTYAGFPSHDMSGGFTFEYPIHYGR